MTHAEKDNRARLQAAGVGGAESWRPLDAALVPKDLAVDGARLTYDAGWFRRERAWPRDLLTAFVALRQGTSKDILNFAKRAGVLALCHHGLPWTHVVVDGGHLVRDGYEVDRSAFPCVYRVRGAEPLSAWRWLANDAHAILNVAAQLKAGRPGALADWNTICELQYDSLRPADVEPSQEAHMVRADNDPRKIRAAATPHERESQELRDLECDRLAAIVNQWLAWGDVRPHVRFHYRTDLHREPRRQRAPQDGRQHPRLELSGGLFGALAVQLAAFVTGTRGIEHCSCCGEFFTPEKARAARRGPGRYCPDCQGSNEAGRLASKALRDRKARARALQLEGKSIEEIARDLERTPAKVRAWLESRKRK